YFLFFFSSRRRHTRFSRDWSSDVCSSDLTMAGVVIRFSGDAAVAVLITQAQGENMTFADSIKTCFAKYFDFNGRASRPELWWWEIGRASCRERVSSEVGAVSLKEKEWQ